MPIAAVLAQRHVPYHIRNISAQQFSYGIDQEICMTNSSAVPWRTITLPTAVSTLRNTTHASLHSQLHSENNLQCRNENVIFVIKNYNHKLTHHRHVKHSTLSVYRASFLCVRARQFYRTEGLHPPEHTTAVSVPWKTLQ
jgi:hypothetical protein